MFELQVPVGRSRPWSSNEALLYRLEAYGSSCDILGISVSVRAVDAKKTGARINAMNDCLNDRIVRDGKSGINCSRIDVEKT